MEGIGQLAARRAAPPDTVNAPSDAGSAPSDGGIATSDGGIATLRPVTRRLKPVGARHAQFQSQAGILLQDRARFRDGTWFQNLARLQDPARLQNPAAAVRFPAAGLDPVVAAMDALRSTALSQARLFGVQEAADFAGKVEEISRTVEFLQLVAAQAVDRTRNEARTERQPSAAPGWRTGWTEPDTAASEQAASEQVASEQAAPALNPVDDGYRNTAEFLRARLRISIGEARRRLTLASGVLPQTGIAGQELPARHPILAQALASASVPSRSATLISLALDRVRHLADTETTLHIELSLTRNAVESDPDFVARMAKH
ncbi:DUF222 domain-containing protein, partial [Arthrobacter alkaliphilus]